MSYILYKCLKYINYFKKVIKHIEIKNIGKLRNWEFENSDLESVLSTNFLFSLFFKKSRIKKRKIEKMKNEIKRIKNKE